MNVVDDDEDEEAELQKIREQYLGMRCAVHAKLVVGGGAGGRSELEAQAAGYTSPYKECYNHGAFIRAVWGL